MSKYDFYYSEKYEQLSRQSDLQEHGFYTTRKVLIDGEYKPYSCYVKHGEPSDILHSDVFIVGTASVEPTQEIIKLERHKGSMLERFLYPQRREVPDIDID